MKNESDLPDAPLTRALHLELAEHTPFQKYKPEQYGTGQPNQRQPSGKKDGAVSLWYLP